MTPHPSLADTLKDLGDQAKFLRDFRVDKASRFIAKTACTVFEQLSLPTDRARCFHSFATKRQLCLPANTHVLFLGESTLRFQYLLLAWPLLHGVEYRDCDQDATDPRRLHDIDSFSGRSDT